MKTPLSLYSVCCLLSAAVLFWLAPPGRAEIPEPPTLFYGQIVNRTSGQPYVLTNGTLVWKIVPAAGGAPVVLTTPLGTVAAGGLSYQLKVPHEALAPGALVAQGSVPLPPGGLDYEHLEVTVDGFPAKIQSAAGEAVHLSQAARATALRLDLELVNPLADSDGDGLPDWWEDRCGLNRNLAADALLDRDGDGASNLKEFRDGSDPNAANSAPSLVTEPLAGSEGGTAGVRLRVLDSDSQPGDLRYTLRRAPAAGTLFLRNGAAPASPGGPSSDRALRASDTFTQADVNAGRLIFRHEDWSASATSLELIVNDETPAHPASTGTVAIAFYRPSTSGASPARLWLDAAHAASAGGTTWPDRSGNHYNAIAPNNQTPVFETSAPGGQPSLRFTGGSWGLAVLDETAAFPPGERTVFAVFKAEGAGRQQVFGGTRFELGLTAADDPTRPSQLRYATESAALYGPRSLPGQWVLASVWEQNAQAHLEVNGLWSAGPNPAAEITVLANKSAIGGKPLGHYNPVTRSWDYAPVELLSGQVGEILVFNRAMAPADRRRLNYHLLSKWFGYVLWDASAEARPVAITAPSAGLSPADCTNYVVVHGRDRSNVILGGAGADELRGGMEDDILAGGPGNNVLAGGGGRDVFVIGPDSGNDTILDFRAADGCAIDLSDLLAGASRNLADYVALSTAGSNSWLRVNTAGAGAGFANVQITLVNTVLRQSDLPALWANGNIITRGIGVEGPAWITVAASRPNAGEEGPTAGEFILARTGSTESALTVSIALSGSAVNGVDYSFIGPSAVFAPGQSTLKLPVQPYVDTAGEGPEVVELLVAAGSGYNVGTASRAQVTIADLPERISIRALEPVASRVDGVPAWFLVSRSGVAGHSTVARLAVSGTAVNGVDYQRISTVLMFDPAQTEALIAVTPLTGRPPITSAKSVEVRILPDPSGVYLLGALSTERVWLVEEVLDLGLWRARSMPGATTDLALFAGQDPDHDGLVNLVDYALGLDPAHADGAEAKALRPRARIRDGRLAVEFKRRVAATDLEYLVEVSSDLVTWHSGSQHVEEITVPEFASQPEMVCVRDRTPAESAARRFIRVRVQLKQ